MLGLAVFSVSVASSVGWIISQQEPYAPLAQYGLAGIVIAALFTFARTTVTRMAKELDDERAYSRSLSERIETQIIPAALRLAEVADRLARYTESKP